VLALALLAVPAVVRGDAAAVEGPVSARCPASALQLHPHVSVLVDPPAARALQDTDYYRQVWRDRPRWQAL
jgi:glucosamine-6-phosphate deaminase